MNDHSERDVREDRVNPDEPIAVTAELASPRVPARPEVEVFVATSIDGFVARSDGGLDWLAQVQAAAPAGEDFGYAAFMARIDALVMGRKTFETVREFDPWPYGSTPVHVMTRRGLPASALPLPAGVQVHGGPPVALLAALAAGGARRVYVDGGELIQAFLHEDLVDRVTLTTVPVLLGAGRRLFGALPCDRRWVLETARHWDACGFVQVTWRCR